MKITSSKNNAAKTIRINAKANEPNSGDAILMKEKDKPQTAAKTMRYRKYFAFIANFRCVVKGEVIQ